MIKTLPIIIYVLTISSLSAQPLQLLDRFNGNKVVNDSVLTVYSTDPSVIDLTKYFTMKNNTDKTLSLYLKKSVNMIADSTIDYYCFGIKCWPGSDSTDYPDSIAPGAEDYTFASHVVHYRRFELPPLPPGKSSISYTIYDNTTFPEPVTATVTVVYHLSGVGIEERSAKSLNVYPNPVKEILTIESEELNQSYTLHIYDWAGHLIRNLKVTSENKRVFFNTSALPVGCYYGKLISDKSATGFKFLKSAN